MITVFPSSFSDLKSAMISPEVLVSNAPVGSSARIKDGSFTIALAIQFIDRLVGKLRYMPTRFNADNASAFGMSDFFEWLK